MARGRHRGPVPAWIMGLDDPGDLSAPVGSTPWAHGLRYTLYRLAKDSTAKLGEFQSYLALMERHCAYQYLPDEHGHPFQSLRAFAVAKVPFGMGYDVGVVEALQAETRDMLLGEKVAQATATVAQRNQAADWVAQEIGPQGKHRPHRDTNEKDITMREGGTSASYALRRLAKDRPDLHAQCLAGAMTPHAAMLQAGWRKRPPSRKRTPLDWLRHYWLKASPEDRQRFEVEVLGAQASTA